MKRLILIPTDFERRKIVAALQLHGDGASIELHLCGFGPIAAASRSASLIAQHRPDLVVLVGIAGALSDRMTIGEAYEFSSVTCDGIGIGWGDHFQSAAALGWPQLDASENGGAVIGDRIGGLVSDSSKRLLTVCSSSHDAQAADARRERYPDADAEDMEGFGVSLSCKLDSVPLTILRGISNRAGNRDHTQWRVDDALANVAKRICAID